MPFRHTVKQTLKRGCLVAAANWQVTIIQAVGDALFKLLIAVPIVGGIFLVALVVGADPGALASLEWRDLAATIVASLVTRPVVLAAFLAAVGVVIVGGSLFVFLLKAGTVSVLVRGERRAGPIEQPPLHFETIGRAAAFTIESFSDAAGALFPRFARLGFFLMGIYLASAAVYFAAVYASYAAGDGLGSAAFFTVAFVAWITFVNLLYLLIQIVIAADDCSVASAARRVAGYLRRDWQYVSGVFVVVLTIVVVATGASVLATASLGFISFVPFFGPLLGLAVLPLQLLAWVLREIVFQYIGLSSVGAYLTIYRRSLGGQALHEGDAGLVTHRAPVVVGH